MSARCNIVQILWVLSLVSITSFHLCRKDCAVNCDTRLAAWPSVRQCCRRCMEWAPHWHYMLIIGNMACEYMFSHMPCRLYLGVQWYRRSNDSQHHSQSPAGPENNCAESRPTEQSTPLRMQVRSLSCPCCCMQRCYLMVTLQCSACRSMLRSVG